MSLVLLGILIALGVLVFGSNLPQIRLQGLSEQLLRWKGIETTRVLAESSNSKLIIAGGWDGLPLILNTETGGPAGK